MQIEKHIKIVSTPTGAVVFFAGQVCLNINEHFGRYIWSISPVFARLTTGISNCFEVPIADWLGQETLAEAIADGLTRLDEMKAFYGVIDMPEDTYVDEHLTEEVDEDTDYSGVEADVKRTGKTHEQLAADHRAYAKQMCAIGKDGLAVRSEMLANDHDKAAKKTNESVEDLLSESFIVRQVGKSINYPPRIMISADAVVKRAREMAKEAGSKSYGNYIKLAHNEIASIMKAESEEFGGDQIEEGFNETDEVFLTPQTGPMAHMRYNTFKEGSVADHRKAIKYHSKDADRATPQKAAFHDMRAKIHADYLSGTNEGVQEVPGYASWYLQKQKKKDVSAANRKNSKDAQTSKIDSFKKSQVSFKESQVKEEFVQYEDALPEAFQLIKEDCRNEAMTMTDSLVEAHQLANELFEDIVEEYLNELSNGILASYKRKAGEYASAADKAANISFKAGEIDLGKRWTKRADKKFSGIIKATNKQFANDAKNEEVEDLDEARITQPLKDHPYHKKSDAELNYIVKDAGLAARANKGGSAEGKYLDQMNDASTVLYYRKNGGKQVHESLDEAESVQINSPGNKLHGKTGRVFFKHPNGDVNVQVQHSNRKGDVTNLTLKSGQFKSIKEEVELDEAALSGDAYWKAKEDESKQEFLKAQCKALGLSEPVKRGRGKPTMINRDLLKTRAHSNVEAGLRPTAGFDRNEKIHFVRHLKNHPDFVDKHVSQAGRPVGTTKAANQQKELAKKKQDSAFSMWAGLGKR